MDKISTSILIVIVNKIFYFMSYYVGAIGAGILGYIMGAPTPGFDVLHFQRTGRFRYQTWGNSFAGAVGGITAYNMIHKGQETPKRKSESQGGRAGIDSGYGSDKKQRIMDPIFPSNSQTAPMPVVRPSLDNLPSGISATSSIIRVGRNRIRYRKGTHFMFFTQTNAVIGQGITNNSGLQYWYVPFSFCTVRDFCRSDQVAPSLPDGSGRNLFAFNPDQLTTGSAWVDEGLYPNAAGLDLSAGAGGTVKVGNRVTGSLAPMVPKQDLLDLTKIHFTMDISNCSNAAVFMSIYFVKAVRDLRNGEDPLTMMSWIDNRISQDAGATNIPSANPASDISVASLSVVHTVPSSSVHFRNCWKVIHHEPCNIAASGVCKKRFTLVLNREIHREWYQVKNDQNVLWPKGCIMPMISIGGQAVMITGSPSATLSDCQVAFVNTVKYEVRYPPKRKDIGDYQVTVTNLSGNTGDANQKFGANSSVTKAV